MDFIYVCMNGNLSGGSYVVLYPGVVCILVCAMLWTGECEWKCWWWSLCYIRQYFLSLLFGMIFLLWMYISIFFLSSIFCDGVKESHVLLLLSLYTDIFPFASLLRFNLLLLSDHLSQFAVLLPLESSLGVSVSLGEHECP